MYLLAFVYTFFSVLFGEGRDSCKVELTFVLRIVLKCGSSLEEERIGKLATSAFTTPRLTSLLTSCFSNSF